MVNYLIDNWFSLSGYLIGLLSFIWAIITYYKSRKEKKLSFLVQNFNLIYDTLKTVEGLNVTFKNTKVENLSVAEFTIWNSGTDTINDVDVAKNSRVRIVVSEGLSILEHSVSSYPNPSNGITITPEYDGADCVALLVEFDYLDSKDGLSIQIYHTGTHHSNLTLAGAIRGVKKFEQAVGYGYYQSLGSKIASSKIKGKTDSSMWVVVVAMAVLFAHRFFSIENKVDIFDFLLIALVVLVSIGFITDFRKHRRNMPPNWVSSVYQRI